MVRYHLIISGRVQGIGFRASTALKARMLGVTGWVKNTFDGKVEVVVEGKEGRVEKFIKWCKKGPSPFASVENAEVTQEKYKQEFDEFMIRY